MSNSNQTAFVNARILQSRLVSERVTSAQARAQTKESLASKSIQLETETTSNFEIGLDDPQNPKALSVEIEFSFSMKQPDSEKLVVDYLAKHHAQFSVISWIGFDDWAELPEEVLAPYIAMVHDIAIRKADVTLHEMGIRGAGLPRPDSFAGYEKN